tara:strand:+ start:220 stop:876 length:657 start_codon:yes stop_codon:yes gene_type:complete
MQKNKPYNIKKITTEVNSKFKKIHQSREQGLSLSREIIGISSRAIRSAQRKDFKSSEKLINDGLKKLSATQKSIKNCSLDINTIFFLDGEKELCEAIFFLSFVSGYKISKIKMDIFSPSSILKGMAEAASELRRTSLDNIRENKLLESENYLGVMNEVVDLLESVDYPEGVTQGLRRTTDQLRSVVERTRGDITIALQRNQLEEKIENFMKKINSNEG